MFMCFEMSVAKYSRSSSLEAKFNLTERTSPQKNTLAEIGELLCGTCAAKVKDLVQVDGFKDLLVVNTGEIYIGQ